MSLFPSGKLNRRCFAFVSMSVFAEQIRSAEGLNETRLFQIYWNTCSLLFGFPGTVFVLPFKLLLHDMFNGVGQRLRREFCQGTGANSSPTLQPGEGTFAGNYLLVDSSFVLARAARLTVARLQLRAVATRHMCLCSLEDDQTREVN